MFQEQIEDIIIIDDSVSDSDDSIKDEVCFLHGDKSVPIFSSRTHYNYSEAVEILLSREHKERVCTKHPIAVEENASFLVDLDKLAHVDDIKSDDCGHWKHNGRKTMKVAVWNNKSKITKVVSTSKTIHSPPDENSKLYTLSRVYYVNDPHSDFKRTYYYLYGEHYHILKNHSDVLISF